MTRVSHENIAFICQVGIFLSEPPEKRFYYFPSELAKTVIRTWSAAFNYAIFTDLVSDLAGNAKR